jgi:hypothetical protein
MNSELVQQVALLDRVTTVEIRERYLQLFGEPPCTKPKARLVQRIAWRLQALAEGDLSERARQRASEVANDADLRVLPPRSPRPASAVASDRRLPTPGTILARRYKDKVLQVKVRLRGFEYEGVLYKSLSGVAKAITGSHCNGYLFFRLTKETRRGKNR